MMNLKRNSPRHSVETKCIQKSKNGGSNNDEKVLPGELLIYLAAQAIRSTALIYLESILYQMNASFRYCLCSLFHVKVNVWIVRSNANGIAYLFTKYNEIPFQSLKDLIWEMPVTFCTR